MSAPAASIIIPAFNHARYLRTAIDSALAQTEPIEAIVVDDGSTDWTPDVLDEYRGDDRVRYLPQRHAGVAEARNRGLRHAEAGLVMFLDADDTIDPRKIELQRTALLLDDDLGWVLCDIRITDEARPGWKGELASERYGYASMNLSGRIGPLLAERNFIPVHSPLVRRSVIGDIRFRPGPVEDWAFWREIAACSSVGYLPTALATYKRRRGGRHNS